MAFFPGSHADDADDGHDHHEGAHHKSQFFYNPPKLNCNVILDGSGELEEAPRRLFCCCSFEQGRPVVHRYQPVDSGHDWFAIFFDLVFVGVAFSLGHTLMHNLGLYGALVTAGLMVPVFQTWFRVAKFANMFSGTVDTYVLLS